nr:MAG TPA: hypothetical protein [Caudoviricetes sp.]
MWERVASPPHWALTGFEPVDVFPIDNTPYPPYRKTI